jgi:hypothetical protein
VNAGHAIPRLALLALQSFIAVSAIDGGMALLRGAYDGVLSVAWLAGTPFGSYTVPGLALVLLVGGTALVAATSVFIYEDWAVLTSMVSGLTLAAFLTVEILSLDAKVGEALPMVLTLQVAYFVSALAVIALSALLWRTRPNRDQRALDLRQSAQQASQQPFVEFPRRPRAAHR